MNLFLNIKNLSFSYGTAAEPLFENLNLSFCEGWTGVVGENGCGKSTLLQLASGILKPDRGNVNGNPGAVYCEQRTDSPASGQNEFYLATDKYACLLRGGLGIEDAWCDRWESLSHGERKRAQIAVALWKQPLILAVDEPTNHLDRNARDMIVDSLKSFKGIGLIVSHDRELLDELCTRCLFISHPDIKLYIGNYSRCAAQKKLEDETAEAELLTVRRNYEKLKKEIQQRREAAERSDKNRSKRHIGRNDHDAKEKIDRYIVSGRDGRAGQLKRQLDGRLFQARDRMMSIKTRKGYDTGIRLDSEVSGRNRLFSIPGGRIDFGGRSLFHPELEILPEARISLTGPNGSGKSTLVRLIRDAAGITDDKLIYVPQEIDSDTSKRIINEVKMMSNERKAGVMSIIRRLGSDPGRVLATDLPSPGEVRKLLIAGGIQREPHLIIMDEPTNHLDLVSIECLENALSDCHCGLLLVSHDFRFLKKLTSVKWNIFFEGSSGFLNKSFWDDFGLL